MQPREQKGEWSFDGGFPHTGQSLETGLFGIGAMDGDRCVGAQGDRAADLRRKLFEPAGIGFQHGDDGGMTG